MANMVWHGMHGMAWYDMAWYVTIWHGMAWNGMAWCDNMAWHGTLGATIVMAWHGMAYNFQREGGREKKKQPETKRGGERSNLSRHALCSPPP